MKSTTAMRRTYAGGFQVTAAMIDVVTTVEATASAAKSASATTAAAISATSGSGHMRSLLK